MNFRVQQKILFHLVGWVLLFTLVIAFLFGRQEIRFSLPFLLTPAWLFFACFFLLVFYTHSGLLIPHLYDKRRYLLYVLSITIIIVAALYLRPYDALVRATESPRFGPVRFPRRAPPIDIISVLLSLGSLSVSTLISTLQKLNESEKRIIRAETDRVNAELSFLKAQINPHFLLNTLNNIYTLALTKNAKAPEAIMKLSHILRYVIDESENNFVPIRNEIACAEDFIDLQKLRLNEKTSVRFSVEGNVTGKQVPPLLLLTFIENAFKYGVSNHTPAEISINIKVEENLIGFRCKNIVFAVGSGEVKVGLTNIRKRLNHLYPGKYFLHILNHDRVFEVELQLRD